MYNITHIARMINNPLQVSSSLKPAPLPPAPLPPAPLPPAPLPPAPLPPAPLPPAPLPPAPLPLGRLPRHDYKTYVYTIRDAKINSVTKYVELIPKLFDDSYRPPSQSVKRNFNDIDSTVVAQYQKKLFTDILNDSNNYINTSSTICEADREKIIKLNIDLYYTLEPKKFDRLIEHLYQAHLGMGYGIYFSIGYAMNDVEFIENFTRLYKDNSDQKILLYTPLDNLIKYVMAINDLNNFCSPLLYINQRWEFGSISRNTIVLDKSNPKKFIDDIKSQYPSVVNFTQSIEDSAIPLHLLHDPELICQIPLPIELMKFIFIGHAGGSIGGGSVGSDNDKMSGSAKIGETDYICSTVEFRRKYYKRVYLEYKQIYSNMK
jgi:hypothetical protein